MKVAEHDVPLFRNRSAQPATQEEVIMCSLFPLEASGNKGEQSFNCSQVQKMV